MGFHAAAVLVLVFGAAVQYCHAYETDASCTFDNTVGTWLFQETDRNHALSIDCFNTTLEGKLHTRLITIQFPDVANDAKGYEGRWTMFGDNGFEVIINNRKYMSFFNFDIPGNKSLCNELITGWSHDVYSRDWSCFSATKQNPTRKSFPTTTKTTGLDESILKRQFQPNPQVVQKINSRQDTWTAATYEDTLGKYTNEEIIGLMGGRNSRFPRNVFDELKAKKSQRKPAESNDLPPLPEEFDWRNVRGQNYVSPVRNQGGCGSCYAFASTAMLEARVRVHTNNQEQTIFSPQDVVDCNEYSSACGGGWPYLVAGKYAESFGFVEESSNPYVGTASGHCTTPTTARRYYASEYHYVGGYLGANDEEEMKRAIIARGPIVVCIDMGHCQDLLHYRNGIFQPTGEKVNRHFDPMEPLNHAVLVVGWGVDQEKNIPYWIVKNSWGAGWGDHGYFKIRRGIDDCGVEMMPTEAMPLTTY